MALNKKEEFKKAEVQLADFFKVLSHPARIAILKALAKHKSCICGELVDVLPLAQSTVSQHLKELKRVGLIQGTVDGPKSCYCINWDVFKQFDKQTGMFTSALLEFAQKNNCC